MKPKWPLLIGNEAGKVGSVWESSGEILGFNLKGRILSQDYEGFTQRTTRGYDVGGDADANASFNPFSPKSDQHQFSPSNIKP